jgi:hypothetical protein
MVAGTTLAGAAERTATAYTQGNPQPELALFDVGSAGGSFGSGTVLPDGTLVLVSPSPSATTAVVCTLRVGARGCSSTATLDASVGGSFSGVAEVLSTGGSDVSVVMEDCCRVVTRSQTGGVVVFNSTNDATTFSSELSAGTLSGVAAATFADGKIAVVPKEAGALRVQAFSPSSAGLSVSTAAARLGNGEVNDTSLATYDQGLLVASDNALGETSVRYARSGSNFNSAASYKVVGTFDGEDLAAVSANALLTYSATASSNAMYLRFFNGTSFVGPYNVPQPTAGDDVYPTIEETGNVVHVVFANRANNYDIYGESTTNGTQWSSLSVYHTAVTAGSLVPVLGSSGTGLVYETDSTPLLAQPVLDPQSVVVTSVGSGTHTTLDGRVSPPISGQAVWLERLSAEGWYDAATTAESAAGKFSFEVSGPSTYRAVVAYEPGQYLYGYSNALTLRAAA